MIHEKVRHRTTPSEPYAAPHEHGRITRTKEDGSLRITPAARNIPAQAYVSWRDGEYATWEKLSDLQPVKGRK